MDCEATKRNLLESMLLDASAKPTDLPLSLLKSITNGFSDDNRVGRGGFAVVYKAKLQNGVVAVKKLFQALDLHEKNFNQEVSCLMRVRHKNIVRFLGYCADTQGKVCNYEGKMVMADERERLLCFEFVPNGNLERYITDAFQGLGWSIRYQLIKGICEGLHYLHQNKILHLDLKPANVLIDHNMVPKIADFGLSRCFDENQSHAITSNLAGTVGYMAPEFSRGEIRSELDIYSLGVIIMEILTGQKGYTEIEDVLEIWSNRFGTLQGDTRLEQVRVCAEIGLQCIESNQRKRKTTQCILEKLDEMECRCSFIFNGISTSPVAHSKAKTEKNEAIGHSANENSCQLCRVDKITFEPPPIYASKLPLQMQPINELAKGSLSCNQLDAITNLQELKQEVGNQQRQQQPVNQAIPLSQAQANLVQAQVIIQTQMLQQQQQQQQQQQPSPTRCQQGTSEQQLLLSQQHQDQNFQLQQQQQLLLQQLQRQQQQNQQQLNKLPGQLVNLAGQQAQLSDQELQLQLLQKLLQQLLISQPAVTLSRLLLKHELQKLLLDMQQLSSSHSLAQQRILPQRMPFTMVYKRGAVGRSIDIGGFSGYEELKHALACMFGIEGQLEDRQRIGWKLVYKDHEDDILLLGDDLWEEFVNCVKCIRILSPLEVQQMSLDGDLGNNVLSNQACSSSDGGNAWKPRCDQNTGNPSIGFYDQFE